MPSRPPLSPQTLPSLAAALADFGLKGAAGKMTEALRRLEEPETVAREVGFPVESRITLRRRKGDLVALDRKRAKKLIRPENAALLLENLPESEWDRTHAVVCGDFIFGDFIGQLLEKVGPCPKIDIATLSMSAANAQMLGGALKSSRVRDLRIVLSHYFRATNPEVIAAIDEHLVGAQIIIGRCHCKIVTFDYPDRPLVFETSANLRSSNCMEQVSIFCDRDLLNAHAAWISQVDRVDEATGFKGEIGARSKALKKPALFTEADKDT